MAEVMDVQPAVTAVDLPSTESDGFKAPSLPSFNKSTSEVEVKLSNVDQKPPERKSTTTSKDKEALKSPAENLKPVPPLPYKEPAWSGTCSHKYTVEVIKNGVSVSEIALSSKPFWVVGRLPQCDVSMEHPSLSRYHAVIQFCAVPTDKYHVGWYLFDLDSTHGCTLNKKRVAPSTYHRLRVGYTFKFGGSTRLHILHGPDEDQEVEISPEELVAMREKRKALLEEKVKARAEANDSNDVHSGKEGGCSWGMDDDAEDVDPSAVNPFSTEATAEPLNLDDPKKTLRGWFEREGYDEPEYIVEEQSHGRHKCIVELPLDTPTGHPMRAEVSVQGKKKEAVVQCALEACKILDRQGVLRQAKHESRKRKVRNWDENDYYDSDEDTFLDRTGDVERKRQMRMKRAGKLREESQQVLTFDQLVEKLDAIRAETKDLQSKIERSKQLEKKKTADMDDLDAYMMSIKAGGMNATEKTKCKRRLIELKQDELRTQKLVNMARPSDVPKLKKSISNSKHSELHSPKDELEVPLLKEHSKNNSAVECSVEAAAENLPTVNTDNSNTLPDAGSANISAQHQKISDRLKASNGVSHIISDIASKAPVLTTQAPVSDADDTSCIATVSLEQAHVTSSKITDSFNEALDKSIKAPVTSANIPVTPAMTLEKSTKTSVTSMKAPVLAAKTQATKAPAASVKAPVVSSLAGMVSDLKTKKEEEQLMNDPNFACWLPPKGQSGDGRTSLNDKYGY